MLDVKAEVKAINEQIEQLKERFATEIKDKSISLDVRWGMFKDAPGYLKEHDLYYPQFKCENKFGEISWYDDFYVERYETARMTEIIERLQEKVNDGDHPQEFCDAMKEEVLQMNLGSFRFDW